MQRWVQRIILATVSSLALVCLASAGLASDWQKFADSSAAAIGRRDFAAAEETALHSVRIAKQENLPPSKLLKSLYCLASAYLGGEKIDLAKNTLCEAIVVHEQIPEAIRLQSDLAEIRAKLAKVYMVNGQYAKAEGEWSSVRQLWLKVLPFTSEPLLDATIELAEVYRLDGKYKESIDMGKQAGDLMANLKSVPDDRVNQMVSNIAWSYTALQQPAKALPYFDELIKSLFRNGKGQSLTAVSAIVGYATCLDAQGRLAEALPRLRQVENLSFPGSRVPGDCLFIIGHLYLEQQKNDLAAAYYQKAADIYAVPGVKSGQTGLIDALIAEATTAYAGNQLDLCGKVCDKAIVQSHTYYGDHDLHTATVLVLAGNLATGLGQQGKAKALFERALQSEFDLRVPATSHDEKVSKNVISLLTNTVNMLADVPAQNGQADQEKAYAYFLEQFKKCPTAGYENQLLRRLIIAKLGELAARLGKLDEAVQYYQRVIGQQDKAPLPGVRLALIFDQLAAIYDRQTKHDLAIDARERARVLRLPKR